MRTRAAVLSAEGNPEAALKMINETIDLQDQSLKLAPLEEQYRESRSLFHSLGRSALAGYFQWNVYLLKELKRDEDIVECWEQVLKNARLAVEAGPGNWVNVNNLAWQLSVCPIGSLRDVQESVRLARRSVELNPGTANARNTLAVAYYRAGNLEAALSEFDRSQDLDGGNSFDWYFRAMLHHKLGDETQAAFWLRRATKWHEENDPDNDELKRFRAEADELLNPARVGTSR